jgi:hypothetical protein
VASIAGRKKLAGDDGLLDSEHRFAKGKHHRNEELTANSRRCFAGAEERLEELAARGNVLGLRRDPDEAAAAPRARFCVAVGRERSAAEA